jgi:hypothetical protein
VGFRIQSLLKLATHFPSSKIAFLTFVGTGAYFNGSITDDARPVLIDRNSVV